MARSANGIIFLAVILGVVTAVLIWRVQSEQAKLNVKNWQPIVVANGDIPPRIKITRDMVRLENYPPNLIPDGSIKDINQVVDRMTQNKINVQARVRVGDLLQPGQSPTLAYRIPDGMRAVTIGGDEVRFVAGSVQVNDHIDIIATYYDPRTKQDVTRMILQDVLVLMVNRADDPSAKGAMSSMTLAVLPEKAELLKAAERSGSLSVSLRANRDNQVVQTPGYTPKLLAASDQEDDSSSALFSSNRPPEQTAVNIQVIQPPPRPPAETEIKVFRGTDGEKDYTVSPQPNQ